MDALKLAAAFIGLIVGAGFASGQEILQFFTNFGWFGTLGAILAGVLFGLFGLIVARLSSEIGARSHKEVIQLMCGRYIGLAIDVVVTVFLIGVVVVMFAGSGALFEQQFGLPSIVGSSFMAIATTLTVLLNIQRLIIVIGALTPWLMAVMIGLVIYALSTMSQDLAAMDAYAEPAKAAAPNWVWGAVLYVSYNVAAGVPMLAVMAGTMRNTRSAALGGLLGGLGLGLLILLIHLAMMARLDEVRSAGLPILSLADGISPVVGYVVAFILLGMIYNTAVGMLYSFTARIADRSSPRFNLWLIGAGIFAFVASFVGFIQLVGIIYPITGYLGLMLLAGAVVTAVRRRATWWKAAG